MSEVEQALSDLDQGAEQAEQPDLVDMLVKFQQRRRRCALPEEEAQRLDLIEEQLEDDAAQKMVRDIRIK